MTVGVAQKLIRNMPCKVGGHYMPNGNDKFIHGLILIKDCL